MSDKSIYYLSVLEENFNFRFYLRIRVNLCQYALCSEGLLRQRFDLFTVMMISDMRNLIIMVNQAQLTYLDVQMHVV